ncbi:MAG: hypothetical protein PHN63_00735, partial [Candidatus Omnitrophica bacterium]|nr:hypothetical protein [Candidatus Omnitrophota bacterium]
MRPIPVILMLLLCFFMYDSSSFAKELKTKSVVTPLNIGVPKTGQGGETYYLTGSYNGYGSSTCPATVAGDDAHCNKGLPVSGSQYEYNPSKG